MNQFKHELEIIQEQVNPQKAHQNQLVQELFKYKIYLADGITNFNNEDYVTLINSKGYSSFIASQIEIIKKVGGIFSINFDSWIVKLDEPRENFSEKFLANNIIDCGICGEKIIWDNNRQLQSEFINAKDIGKSIRPRHVCKRDKIVYIHE